MKRSTKVLATASTAALVAVVAGMGTYATFTTTATATETVASGTVVVALGAAGAANRLAVTATGLVPGDSLQRRAQLTNTGTQDFASVTLTTTASSSSLLDTDATNGLQMKIERCAGTWTESAAPYTYSCSGAISTVLATRAVIGSTLALTAMNSLTAGSTDDMVVTISLPITADNTFQGLSSTVVYTFDATQRAGTNK